jgi:TetR/AcrR family transcriptional regulator, fatty acid metabolism regulator protein
MTNRHRSTARKEQILKAAERVFARKGFQEATISDVAKEAGLSDATIYEYFSSKEELLFSIPGETTRKGKEILDFHLNYVRGAANRIRSIIYHYLWFYQNNPDYASIAMLVLKQNRKFLETEAYQAVREGSRVILRVVQEGIDAGEFAQETNPFLVRSVILGTIENMLIRRLLHGEPKDLMAFVDPLTDLVIQGIRRQEQTREWNLRVIVDSVSNGFVPSASAGTGKSTRKQKKGRGGSP